MKPINDETIDAEYEKLELALGKESDPTMLILRAHLYTENLLERMIRAKLPRGDKLIDHGQLSYNQKIILVDALSCSNDETITALRNLNKIRNQCAHELDKIITEGDVIKIGSPFGKHFTKMKSKDKSKDALLVSVIHFICGSLTSSCHLLE